mmetsp:Transcript_21981/g.53189  ORF Transcript_21981/g.53189 Transcript_21981/m.53189 type:complete len:665 (+) Transcript_21981:75-2069(+)
MSLLDPSSREPLFPLIVEGIIGEKNDGGGDETEHDPSFYLGDDDNASVPASSEFWTEALSLSCLRRASFRSSVEGAYDDAMPTTLLDDDGGDGNDESERRALHLDRVGKAVGGNDVCAYVACDGTVVNDGLCDSTNGGEHRRFGAAFCMRSSSSSDGSQHLFTDAQMETIARLSGRLLMDGSSSARRWHGSKTVKSTTVASQTAATTDPSSSAPAGGGWFRKISSGVNYAIDRVLTAYDGDKDCSGLVRGMDRVALAGEELDDASSSVKMLLTRDVASAANVSLGDEDDAMTRNRGGVATTTVGEDRALGITDDVISIPIVASVCRHLLSFSQQLTEPGVGDDDDGSSHRDLFTLGSSARGDMGRIMLYRKGWGACSLGSFCRKAGRHYATNQQEAASYMDGEKSMRYGKIISDISEREVDLLASTLSESKYALIEKDIITLFPGGIMASDDDDLRPCQSDRALFQIHVTKLAIQDRMTRLEIDANEAKRSAVTTRRTGSNKLALAHMRRRKAAIEELERCASVLANLDAGELRLERARDDAQIVQSYALLGAALRDVRESNGIDDVEELMLDIREEIEDAAENIGVEAFHTKVSLGEDDELNEEFRLLELECENEECIDPTDGIGERQSANDANDPVGKIDEKPIVGQQTGCSKTSRAEAVPA